jgi:hypothetical protein
MDNNSGGSTEPDHPDRRPAGREFAVHPGMEVRSSNGAVLGLIYRLYMEDESVSSVLVAHRPGSSQHKRLESSMVDHLEGETVILSISAAEFRLLPEHEFNNQ